MKRYSAIVGIAAARNFTAFWHSHPASGQADAGWVTLFDGSNLNDWKSDRRRELEDRGWRRAGRQGQRLSGLQEFLHRFPAHGGILGRHRGQQRHLHPLHQSREVWTDSAYEVNIFDTRPDPRYGTGAIVNIAKVSPMPKAGEKWNTYEVTAKGPKMTVTLNGVRTVDGVEDTKFPSGRIALQYGAGVVKFRKVQVKPI